MIYFLFDSDGYYIGNDSIQSGNCTDIEPTLSEGYWSRFDGIRWKNEKIPDSAKDLENMVIVSDESLASTHDKEVFALFQKFLDDTHYLEEDSENKTLTFKAYSEEELAEQKVQKEDEEKDQALEQAIDELGKEMLKAQMCENEEWIAEIKAQYQTLMSGDEE